MHKTRVVILAAGLGKRMGGQVPKALMPINQKPMIKHLTETVIEATGGRPVIVIGHGSEMIKSELGDSCDYVLQEEQLGTAHALMVAEEICKDADRIIVMYGDHPFVSKETIKRLLERSEAKNAEITMAVTTVSDFEGDNKVFETFARIKREGEKILGITEYKDILNGMKQVKDVNPGYYVFRANWLWPNLKKIKNENSQKEYYLTDLLKIAQAENLNIENIDIPAHEALGANSKAELEILEKFA